MQTEPTLDGRIRSCYEYLSCLASFCAALLIEKIGFLFFPINFLHFLTFSFILIGFFQLVQARVLKKYHKGLKTIKYYSMSMDDLHISTEYFWVGRGFLWGQKHSQRLYEAKKPSGEKLLAQSNSYNWARKYEANNANSDALFKKIVLKQLRKEYFIHYKWLKIINNPLLKLPPVGGSGLIHGVGLEDEVEINIRLGSLEGSTLIVGQSGVGKSRTAEIFITADIGRKITKTISVTNEKGEVENRTITRPDGTIIVLDPKGDAALMARCYTEAKKSGRPFYLFHLGETEISCRYNGIGNFTRLSECATRIAGQLDGSGDSAAFKEFAWRFISIIAKALFDMGTRPTYVLIRKYIMDMEVLLVDYGEQWLAKHHGGEWRDIVASFIKTQKPARYKGLQDYTVCLIFSIDMVRKQNPSLPHTTYDGIMSAIRYDSSYFSKITASLLPLLEKLCAGNLISILSPDYADTKDMRPILDWTQAIRQNAVVYCGFAAMVDRDVATAVSNSMLSDLLSLSGKIYQAGINYGLYDNNSIDKPNIYLHMDEANEMVGEEFIPILNKARGSGVRVMAYTQTREDLEIKMGSAAKAAVIEANFANLIMFRVKATSTAKLLTDQLKEINIYDRSVAAASTTEINSDKSEYLKTRYTTGVSVVSTEPLIHPSVLVSLPIGQAFALLEGDKLWKIRFPLPKETSTTPLEVRDIYSKMKKDYRSYDNWWNNRCA